MIIDVSSMLKNIRDLSMKEPCPFSDELPPYFKDIADRLYPMWVAEWRHQWKHGAYMDFPLYIMKRLDMMIMEESAKVKKYQWEGWVD